MKVSCSELDLHGKLSPFSAAPKGTWAVHQTFLATCEPESLLMEALNPILRT
jgi:hypothetical protein